MSSRLATFPAFILVILLSILAVKPLFRPGFFIIHDDQQIARLYEMDKALKVGQFPIRWVDELGFGYGYALFNFYPPLSYYSGETIHLLTSLSFIDSTKAVWGLVLIGSALSMFFLAKEFWGAPGGVVSAVFYLYAPYHAIDAYVRGALAELFSFVWLPLILLFSYKAVRNKQMKWTILTGIGLGLLMITHNLIFLPFLGIWILWYLIIFLIYGQKKDFLLPANRCLLSALIAFGLTAFFWLPSLAEKQYTLVDELLTKSLASYKIHFVCLPQLWDSPWGFGGSAEGCIDGLSFKIGKLHLLFSAVSLVTAGVLRYKKQYEFSKLIIGSLVLLLLCVFMTTSYSQFIWDRFNFLWYLQFPWRFLEFVTLWTAFLGGSIFLFLKNKIYSWPIAGIIIAGILILNAKLFVPQTFYEDIRDINLLTDQQIKWHVSSTSFEYMPKGVATKYTDLGVKWVDINQDQIAQSHYKIIDGMLHVTSETFEPGRFIMNADSRGGARVQIQTTNFPGWKVFLDGIEIPISDINKYKLISFDFPAGSHQIVGWFTNTPVRLIGNSVSLIFIITLSLWKILTVKRLKKKEIYGT